jgi:peroxiredoxin
MDKATVGRQAWSKWRGFWVLLCCLLLLLSACTAAKSQPTALSTANEPSTMTVDELPLGLGQGYLLAGLAEMDSEQTGLQQGDLAPNFQLQIDDGRQMSLRDLQGRPVLLNFWTTQCSHCRTGLTQLVDSTKQQGASDELVVLAVNVQEELQQIRPFTEEMAMTMPIVLDSDGALRQQYAVKGMPTSVFIDKEGKIAAVWSGVPSKKFLKKFLSQMDDDTVRIQDAMGSSDCGVDNS